MATSSIRNDPPDPRDADLHEHDSHDKHAARIAIVEQHVRLENAHDLEGVLGTFGDTARYDDEPWGEHFNGRDGVRQFYEQLMKALPDLQIEIQRRHVSDDAIILEVMIRGTQLGAWRGLPATGRRVFRAVIRVGRARRPVTDVPEEWPSPALAGGDRTRLTGRLALLLVELVDFPFLTGREHSGKPELYRNDVNPLGRRFSTSRCQVDGQP